MIEEINAEHRATIDAGGTLQCSCGWALEKPANPLIELGKHQKETSKLPHGVYTIDAPNYCAVRCTCGWIKLMAKTNLKEQLYAHQRKVAKLPKGAQRRYR